MLHPAPCSVGWKRMLSPMRILCDMAIWSICPAILGGMNAAESNASAPSNIHTIWIVVTCCGASTGFVATKSSAVILKDSTGTPTPISSERDKKATDDLDMGCALAAAHTSEEPHGLHADASTAPTLGLAVPKGQGRQATLLVVLSSPYIPAGQSRQLEARWAPEITLYFPGEHGLQADCCC